MGSYRALKMIARGVAPCIQSFSPWRATATSFVPTWYQVLCTKYLVQYKVLGTNYLVPSTWNQVLGTKYLARTEYLKVPSTWYQALGTNYLVPSTWYQVLGTEHVVPSWHVNLRILRKSTYICVTYVKYLKSFTIFCVLLCTSRDAVSFLELPYKVVRKECRPAIRQCTSFAHELQAGSSLSCG